MVRVRALRELFAAIDERPLDEGRIRRLGYLAFDGDAFVLMVTLLRTIRSLAEQVARFHGTTVDDVLRVEAVLPAEPFPDRSAGLDEVSVSTGAALGREQR
jgi:hypothetical protein